MIQPIEIGGGGSCDDTCSRGGSVSGSDSCVSKSISGSCKGCCSVMMNDVMCWLLSSSWWLSSRVPRSCCLSTWRSDVRIPSARAQ